MKYSAAIICIISLLTFKRGETQEIIKEGIFVYETVLKLEHPMQSEEESESRKKKKKQLIAFNEQLLRIVDSTPTSEQIKLLNCNSNENYQFVNNGSSFYQMPYKATDFFDFRAMGLIPPTIEYKDDEKKLINGFICKKAIFSLNLSAADRFNMEVWYCPDYKVEANCFNYYFKELKGIPVMFTFKNTKGPSVAGSTVISTTEYLLTRFSTSKLDKSFNSIANREKYRLVGAEQMMEVAMEISKW